MTFALFFLAEYGHIIFMSLLNTLLFFGGWLSPIPGIPDSSLWLALKTGFFVFAFIWVRGSFPRMRYDQLMQLLWKNYLPLSLGYVIFISSVMYAF
jgi:NADH:ubiquinone oxidoreductase subunit H